jgi:hypothetical protein
MKAIRDIARSLHQKLEPLKFSDDEEEQAPAPGENMYKSDSFHQ